MSITSSLLRNLPATKAAVLIEKASVDSNNGVAKILFTTNAPARKMAEVVANKSAMETAFAAILGDKAHVDVSSIHPSENAGHYFAFAKLNTPVVEHVDAVKEGSGFHLVAANVFADVDDNIWEVKENAQGDKILMRNVQEDLSELLAKHVPANIATAAATIAMTDNLEFASLVTFFDPESETMHHGVMVDTASAYDATSKKIIPMSSTMVAVASSPIPQVRYELDQRLGEGGKTIKDVAAANVNSVMDYLNTLYGAVPEFLAAYKAAVQRLIHVNA